MPVGYPGSVLTLDGFFVDGDGDPVDATSVTVDVLTPLAVVLVDDAPPTRHIATGHEQYDFAVPLDAALSAAWLIRWTGTIDGVPRTGTEVFEVAEPAAPGGGGSGDLTGWRPTVQDVANIVPDRTGDPAVHDGTFDATTVPTATQVEGLIRAVQAEVAAFIGEMPSDLCVAPAGGTIGESMAGHVVALGAAYHVELDFYPDQQLTSVSRATMLREDYLRTMKDLAAAANAVATGSDPGDPLRPVATFPAVSRLTQHEVF